MPKVAKRRESPAGFSGFDRNAMQFWHELAAEMNRDWFLANKQRYEMVWVEPMHAVLAGVAAKVAGAYKGVKLSPPRVMRINRDVRFSKDKSPYKTWIGGGVALGDRKPNEGVVAIYLHFGLEPEFAGAGQYMFMDETLAKWRKCVADAKKGPEIARIVNALKKAGYEIAAYETLSRVPKPYDAEHARADLLKMKGLVVGFPSTPKGLIHKPTYVDWLAVHAKKAAPLALWLHKNLR